MSVKERSGTRIFVEQARSRLTMPLAGTTVDKGERASNLCGFGPGLPPPRPSRKLPLPRALRRFLRGERGVGLVELLVVIPMMAVVLLGIYALYNVGAKSQRENGNRISTMLRAQNGLERMTREMRQAVTFTPVSSQILDAVTYVRPSGGGAWGPRHRAHE